MKNLITIKKGFVEIDGLEKIKLEDITVHINELEGIFRADFLLQQLLDYKNLPNKLSIARKLDKYPKINQEVLKQLSDKFSAQ